jgi:hypothetical protein
MCRFRVLSEPSSSTERGAVGEGRVRVDLTFRVCNDGGRGGQKNGLTLLNSVLVLHSLGCIAGYC